MPFHPVTAALMYRGIYTVPNLLSEQRPVDIPEDELEGECPAGTPARRPSYLCAQVKRGLGAQGRGGCLQVPPARWALQRTAAWGGRTSSHSWAPRWGSPRRRSGPAPARVVPCAAETCWAPQRGHGAAQSAVTVRQRGGLGWGSELCPPRRFGRSTRILIPSAAPARGSALALTFRSCRF